MKRRETVWANVSETKFSVLLPFWETYLKACWLGRCCFQHAVMRQILACVLEQTNIQNLPGWVLCMLGSIPAISSLRWMIITSHATCDYIVWRHTVLYVEAHFWSMKTVTPIIHPAYACLWFCSSATPGKTPGNSNQTLQSLKRCCLVLPVEGFIFNCICIMKYSMLIRWTSGGYMVLPQGSHSSRARNFKQRFRRMAEMRHVE